MEAIRESVALRHQAMRECKQSIESIVMKTADLSEKTVQQRRALKFLITAKKEEQKRIVLEDKLISQFLEDEQVRSLSSLNIFYSESLAAMKEVDEQFKSDDKINSFKQDQIFFEITQLFIQFFIHINKTQKSDEIKTAILIQKTLVLPLMINSLIEISRMRFKEFIIETSQSYLKQISQNRPKFLGKETFNQQDNERNKEIQSKQCETPTQISKSRPQTTDGTISRMNRKSKNKTSDVSFVENKKIKRIAANSQEERSVNQLQRCNNFYNNNTTNVSKENSFNIQRSSSQNELRISQQQIKPLFLIRLNSEKIKSMAQRWYKSMYGYVQEVMEIEGSVCSSEVTNIIAKRQSLKKEFEECKSSLISQMLARNNEIKSSIQKYIQECRDKNLIKYPQNSELNTNYSYGSKFFAQQDLSPTRSKKRKSLQRPPTTNTPLRTPLYKIKNKWEEQSYDLRNNYLNNCSLGQQFEQNIAIYKLQISSNVSDTNSVIQNSLESKGFLACKPQDSRYSDNYCFKQQFKVKKEQNLENNNEQNNDLDKLSQEKFSQKMKQTYKIHYLWKRNRIKTSQELQSCPESFSDFHMQSNGEQNGQYIDENIQISFNKDKLIKNSFISEGLKNYEQGSFTSNAEDNIDLVKPTLKYSTDNYHPINTLSIPNPRHSMFYASPTKSYSIQMRKKSLELSSCQLNQAKEDSLSVIYDKKESGCKINSLFKTSQDNISLKSQTQDIFSDQQSQNKTNIKDIASTGNSSKQESQINQNKPYSSSKGCQMIDWSFNGSEQYSQKLNDQNNSFQNAKAPALFTNSYKYQAYQGIKDANASDQQSKGKIKKSSLMAFVGNMKNSSKQSNKLDNSSSQVRSLVQQFQDHNQDQVKTNQKYNLTKAQILQNYIDYNNKSNLTNYQKDLTQCDDILLKNQSYLNNLDELQGTKNILCNKLLQPPLQGKKKRSYRSQF